jgi:hypothetical protein
MSQRGSHTRAVSLLRCVLAMVTVTVAVLCASGPSRSPAADALAERAVARASAPVAVVSVDRAAGDELAPTAPRPCEKKGLSEPSSTRGDVRVGEPTATGSPDMSAQRGTPPSSMAVHAPTGPAPPPSCAIATSTTVLRI